jgi:hypothetical protein
MQARVNAAWVSPIEAMSTASTSSERIRAKPSWKTRAPPSDAATSSARDRLMSVTAARDAPAMLVASFVA